MIFLSLSKTLFSCASPLRRTAPRQREEIKECFTEVKQVFLLYLWDSLVTLELISLIPLVGPPSTDPLAVKLLDNQLYILGKKDRKSRQIIWAEERENKDRQTDTQTDEE